MPLFTVTPGYTFGVAEVVTLAKLNALGQPVITASNDLFNLVSTMKNGFVNGNMQVWQRGTSAKSCSAGAKTWRADRWFARPSGAAITYAQDPSLPTGAVAAYSAKLTGAASVTTVDFGQRIESVDARTNFRATRTFSAYIYNGTGATLTPTLRVQTPSAADNYGTNTNRLAQALQSCPSGAWTQVSYSFDPSTYTDYANGLEIVLQFASGALDSASKHVLVTQLQVEPGTSVTAQEGRLITLELALCQRYCIAFVNQVIGFADTANNLTNKGVFTLPTTMRIKPVWDGNNSATTADGTNDLYTATAGNAGLPIISGYAGNQMMALANDNGGGAGFDWSAGAQINLTGIFTAEDRS